MDKRGEVTPRLYIFGVIIFTLLIMGGVGIMAEFGKTKPSFINDYHFKDFNQSFNRYNDVVSTGDALKTSITSSQAEKGLFGVLDSLINAVWSSIKNIFGTLEFMNTAWSGLSSVFGIPSWVVTLITTLIVTMIAFSIYSLIFQGKA